jgi:hypothetical protein
MIGTLALCNGRPSRVHRRGLTVQCPLMPMSVQCGKAKALLPVLCHGLKVPDRPRDAPTAYTAHPANQKS